MKFLTYFIICVLFYACSALRCQSAVSTQSPDLSRGTDVSNGKETPTSKPVVVFDAVELKRRQSSNFPTSSSHATCGYINGSISNSITCKTPSETCMLDINHGIFGCCSISSACALPTSCVPASSLPSCDSACVADPYITRCAVASPYCNQYVLNTGNTSGTAWYCDDKPSTQTVFLTATNGTKPVATVFTTSMAFPSKTSSPAPSTSGLLTAASPTSGTLSADFPFSMTALPTSSSNTTSESAPVGAIIGGVLGGVFIIGVLIAIFVFCSRTRNTSNQAQVAIAYGPGHASEYYVQPGKEFYSLRHQSQQSRTLYPTLQSHPVQHSVPRSHRI